MCGILKNNVSKETLNKSSAAERRIFCIIRSVLKTGNTYSIPSFLELSAKSKSPAVSSCRFIESFLNVPAEDLEGLVEAGMSVQRLLVNNMVTLTPDDARKIYQEIL